jgi:hypothetical protein
MEKRLIWCVIFGSSPNLCVNSKTYIMSVLTMLPLSLSTALAQCFSVSGMHIRNGLPDVVSYVRRPSLCLLWNEMHILHALQDVVSYVRRSSLCLLLNEMHIRNGLPDVVSYVRRSSLCLLLNEMHIRNGSPDVVSYVRTKKHRMTCFVRKFCHQGRADLQLEKPSTKKTRSLLVENRA